MKLPRPIRFAAALVALVGMLFAQLAVAAYACPDLLGAQADASVAAMVMDTEHQEHQAMPGCAEIDLEQPALCQAHGQAGDQALDKPQAPNVPPAIAILLVPAMQDSSLAYRPVGADTDAVFLTRGSDPPLSIQYCCFRI